MSANYDFYQNPKLPGSKKKARYHARIVPSGTISTEKLAEEIQNRCSLSTADVKAALVALADIMAEKLRDGYSVHLDGIGYLQMTLKCPPVKSPKEVRAESIQFKSVAFRPAARMKHLLQRTDFVRQKDKSHSKAYTDTQIDEMVAAYFEEKETLTRSQFQEYCGLTYSTAVRHLKRLRDEKKIVNIASLKHPLYRKGTIQEK